MLRDGYLINPALHSCITGSESRCCTTVEGSCMADMLTSDRGRDRLREVCGRIVWSCTERGDEKERRAFKFRFRLEEVGGTCLPRITCKPPSAPGQATSAEQFLGRSFSGAVPQMRLFQHTGRLSFLSSSSTPSTPSKLNTTLLPVHTPAKCK
jgi:hypothetical protein